MSKIQIRWNHGHATTGLRWRLIVDNEEYLVRSIVISAAMRTEEVVVDGELKGNVVATGRFFIDGNRDAVVFPVDDGGAEPETPAGDCTGGCSGCSSQSVVTDEMVNRFLMWPLPKGFSPDGGVEFVRVVGTMDGARPREELGPSFWPSGTNLLSADQARAMLEHVLGVQK